MAVTSRDVARLAASPNPHRLARPPRRPRVSEETKKRVRDAAVLLGYVPSEAGRALSSGRTRRIGLLVTDLENQFYAHIIAPLHRELEALRVPARPAYRGPPTSRSPRGSSRTVSMVSSWPPHRRIGRAAAARARGLPFVYFNRTAALVDADATIVAPAAGFEVAVDRALALAIAGSGRSWVRRTRARGARASSPSAPRSPREASLWIRSRATRPVRHGSGDAATAELLGLAEAPSLIFCATTSWPTVP